VGQISVRVLTGADAGLLREAAAAIGGKPITADLGRFLDDPTVVVAVALAHDEPAGLAYGNVIRRPTRDLLMLYEIGVVERYRRQGVGTALVERLKQVCADRQLAEMFVLTGETNVAAMALYRKTGGIRPNRDDVMFIYPAHPAD
jgi:GNAT superfamily N-acetyltransferase